MLTIFEHKNNRVEIRKNGRESQFFLPRIDLEESRRLLEQFNQLTTRDGKPIYTFWQFDGYYLFPGIQEWLYWNFFVPLVQHKEAFQYLRSRPCKYKPFPYYTFSGLKRIADVLHLHSFPKRCLFNSLATALRWRSQSSQVLVSDDGADGFRYRKLKEELKTCATPYTRCEALSKRSLLQQLRNPSYFIIGHKSLGYSSPPKIDYASAEFLHPYLDRKEFERLILSIHRHCSDKIAEAGAMEKHLSKAAPKHFLGYDQVEETLPWIIASKKHGVISTTFQHGVLTKFHSGWLGYGIPPEYCNAVPDRIVVWGKYWQQALEKYSNKYHAGNILVGPHLNKTISYDFISGETETDKRTVLFPFEFLADNISLSSYIRTFLELGWRVIVKIRPQGDGNIDYDTLAYDADVRDRIEYKYDLSPLEIQREISVVACTQSTFAYEMMPFSKPIWYLKTPFCMLEDMVEDGIAHSVSLEDLRRMSDPAFLRPYLKPRYNTETYKQVFSDQPLQDFLRELLK